MGGCSDKADDQHQHGEYKRGREGEEAKAHEREHQRGEEGLMPECVSLCVCSSSCVCV